MPNGRDGPPPVQRAWDDRSTAGTNGSLARTTARTPRPPRPKWPCQYRPLHGANRLLHSDAAAGSARYNVGVDSQLPPAPIVARSSRRIERFWPLIAAACVVPATLDAFQSYMQGVLGGQRGVQWGSVIFSGSEWLFLGALTPIAYYLARRFPLRRETLRRTVIAHVVGSLVLCVGWASAGVALRYALHMVGPRQRLGPHLASWMLTSLPWSVFMYFTVLGCVYAFTYFIEARDREAQAARLAAQLAEARLGALRMQLNPHFLFNSLNAIGVLVRDQKTAEASRMLELLGDVLHSVLRGGADARHEVPLGEEIQFLEQYLAIEQVRFSDRLVVRWDVDDRLRKALVPGLILQPLVENALRHGIAKRGEGGTVEIGARRDGSSLVLYVRDDSPGREAPSDAAPAEHGVGLKNIRERLRTMYGDRATLTLEFLADRGTVATITFPYVEVPHA
jgi:two-component system LytT family sensor kinase